MYFAVQRASLAPQISLFDFIFYFLEGCRSWLIPLRCRERAWPNTYDSRATELTAAKGAACALPFLQLPSSQLDRAVACSSWLGIGLNRDTG
jgi:hypothetical protein